MGGNFVSDEDYLINIHINTDDIEELFYIKNLFIN